MRQHLAVCDQCGIEHRSMTKARDEGWLEVAPVASFGMRDLNDGKLHADVCSLKCLVAWANAKMNH